MPTLLYIADPMCSWCYAFGPELATLLDGLPGLQVELVLGGLRAYNTEVMSDTAKDDLMGHWKKVHESTGLPLIDSALEQPGFIYNTEPACRAVVAARTLLPAAALPTFHAIQQAFYAEGRDVTQGDALARIGSDVLNAMGSPTSVEAFRTHWSSEDTVLATHNDFVQCKRWEITGFPALVLERNGQLDMVTTGYTRVETLIKQMQALVDHGLPS